MHELTDAIDDDSSSRAIGSRASPQGVGFSLEDLLDHALPLLAEAFDARVDGARSRDAAEHAFAESAPPLDCLRAAAAASDLQSHLLLLSPRSLLSGAVPVGLRLVGAGLRGYVVLCVSSPGRARLYFAEGAESRRVVSVEALGELLNALGPDADATWLFVSPATPLSTPSSLSPSHPKGADEGHGAPHADHHHPSPFARVRTLLRLERDDLWVVLVYSVAVGLLSLVTPVAVQSLVNSVAFGALLQPILVLTVIVLTVLGFAALLRGLQVRVVEAVQRRIFVRAALDLSHRLPRVDLGATELRYGPELVNRFFDVLTVQKSASIFLLDGLALALQATIGLIVLAFYHPALLALDALLLAGAAVVVFSLGRGATSTSIDESRAKFALAAWLEELARLPRSFRANSGARLAASRAERLTRQYLTAREAHFRIVFRQIAGTLALQVIANAAVLGVGGALVVSGQLTLGQLVAAELIVTTVVASLAKLGKHFETWYDLLAAVDKLGHLTDLPMEPRGESADFDDSPRGATLRLRDVRFSYGHGMPVIDGLSLELPPGARAVVTGASGEGKSTLAALIDGMRMPDSGFIAVDGVDLREAKRGALRDRVAIVSREPEIIDGSVFENIAAGRSDVSRRDAWDALGRVGLEARVRALPGALDTSLGTHGSPLHHDATVRLALARAIAAQPRLIVLDDVLNGIASPNRERIEAALFDASAPWTLLLLTTPGDPITRRPDLTASLALNGPDPELG